MHAGSRDNYVHAGEECRISDENNLDLLPLNPSPLPKFPLPGNEQSTQMKALIGSCLGWNNEEGHLGFKSPHLNKSIRFDST
jgi:hypothetical protein